MKKSLLARQIVKACYLTGQFTLRSGQTSSEYFDKYRFEANPRLLQGVVQLMAPLVPEGTDLLAGLEMGGIPLATALSLKTGLPARFVRKEAKSYGSREICEGGEILGKTLCLIEDVITTGGQALLSIKTLRSAGAKIRTVLCVIYRGDDPSLFKDQNLELIPLFTREELMNESKQS